MQRSRISQAQPRPSPRGVVTVEMALIAPVVIALLFGVIQFGYAFMVQHALQDAARQGCRAAILPNQSNSTVTTAVSALLQNEGINVAKTTITILVNNAAGDVSSSKAGDQVTVKVTMAFADVKLFPGDFSSFTGTMQGAVTLRSE